MTQKFSKTASELNLISHLVADPVKGVFALTEVLHQFLGLQKTQAFLLGLLQEKVPQTVQLLQTSLKQNNNKKFQLENPSFPKVI